MAMVKMRSLPLKTILLAGWGGSQAQGPSADQLWAMQQEMEALRAENERLKKQMNALGIRMQEVGL
jgi:hypothetical protein